MNFEWKQRKQKATWGNEIGMVDGGPRAAAVAPAKLIFTLPS